MCRSAPGDACSVHGSRPLPGASASRRRAGGRGSLRGTSKWLAAVPRDAGSEAREWRAGAGLRVCRPPAGERAAPRATRPPPSSAGGRRGARPAVFSPGPAPRGGRLCSAQRPAPSRRAEGKPAPGARILAAPQSRSSLNYSQSGGSTRGRTKGQSATSSPPLAPGIPHPATKLTSAHSAAGARTRSKPQPHAVSLRGLPVTLASLRAGASRGRPEGGVGPQKSQQFSTPAENVAGSAAAGTRAGAPSARQNGQLSSSRAPRSQTPSVLIGGRSDTAAAAPTAHAALARGLESPEGTRRWRRRAGRGPRGPAATPAPPPPPWPPLSPRACRPPPPAGCQAHSSPARPLVRAHPERVGAPGE